MSPLTARVPLRLVLDTNVWLDWLVFEDPAVAPITAAVAAGTAEIFIDTPCEDELAHVLGYRFRAEALPADIQSAHLGRCRAIARRVTAAQDPVPLPRCSDPDDQKFLELARDARADCLVTKDLALLAFARHRSRSLAFRIIAPADFVRMPAP